MVMCVGVLLCVGVGANVYEVMCWCVHGYVSRCVSVVMCVGVCM